MIRSLRLFLVVLVLAALVITTQSFADTQDGWYYEAVTGSANAKGKEELTLVHAWISGPYAKIQFVDAPKKGMFKEGAYLMTPEEVGDRLREHLDEPVTEVHMVAGVWPAILWPWGH